MATANRYEQDAEGQWWFYFRNHRRVRATVRRCGQCGKEFPAWRPNQRNCSEECGEASRRERATVGKCERCGELYKVTALGQRFCSHTCAALAIHAAKPVTTSVLPRLVNADNPLFSCDERGQWWYQSRGTKIHARVRAAIRTCVACGKQFLVGAHNKTQQCCSKKCGVGTWHRENPGAFAGDKSIHWKGGRRLTGRRGYIEVHAPEHPSCVGTGRRYVLEHRLVMEQVLGRLLAPNEHVHHKNGIRDDNRPENLELWVGGHLAGQREKERQHCPTCSCFKGDHLMADVTPTPPAPAPVKISVPVGTMTSLPPPPERKP